MKYLFIAAALICSLSGLTGCSAPKFTARINDVDSVIRTVNPDHNCGCDYGARTISYPSTKDGTLNTYFWQTVYIKKEEGIDIKNQSKRIKDELVKFMPELAKYKRFYLEYRVPAVNPADTAQKYTIVGSAFFLKDKCDGFVRDISAKDLIKKSHNKKFEKSLCEKK